MKTLAELKSGLNDSRKRKDTFRTTFLSTFIGELQANATMVNGEKVVTPDEIQAMAKKFMKGVQVYLDGPGYLGDALKEKDILQEIIIEQMTEEEIKEAVFTAKANGNDNMGDIMKFLKENYGGRYDGRLASQVVKSVV